MTFDIEETLKKLTLTEKAQLCSGGDFWNTQKITRLNIPEVMMCDGPNGLRKQCKEDGFDHLGINKSIETVCYPTLSAMASSFDKNLLFELGEVLGAECQSENVSMLLGPGINIKRSPLCGRNFEYFSEDPYLSGKMAVSYIKGLQSQGVAACVKHFAANNQETNRLLGSSIIDERTFHEIYLQAFEMAVKEGNARGIMSAYNAINHVFALENKELLTDILRKSWGFKGLVVSDWGGMKDRVEALKAGTDLEMPGSTDTKVKEIVSAVKSGELQEEILDNAVYNVLDFVKTSLESKRLVIFNKEAARKKSLKFAQESAVLLKNETNVLPLKVDNKVAFIGEFANNPRYQGGGSSFVNVTHSYSTLECLTDENVPYAQGYRLDGEDDEDLLNEAINLAEKSDTVVVFAGLPQRLEAEGVDRKNLKLPQNQNRLIKLLCQKHSKVIVVLYSGSVVELPWLNDVQGILTMYLGGECVGKATLDVLYGYVNPSGKLAESWPIKLEDNPSYLNFPDEDYEVIYKEGIFVGYRYYDKKKMAVAFPFGHGLSYTSFNYSDIKVSRNYMRDDEEIQVSVIVENTGTVFGKEVVQLYVKSTESKVQRPIRELRGFEKISLHPGEKQEVSFSLSKRDFAYYEKKIHDWYVETGDFVIEIGESSRNISQSVTVFVKSTTELPKTFNRFSTIEELLETDKGKEVFGKLIDDFSSGNSQEEDLGRDENHILHTILKMPLFSFYTFEKMTLAEIDQLLLEINSAL